MGAGPRNSRDVFLSYVDVCELGESCELKKWILLNFVNEIALWQTLNTLRT